MAPEIISKKGHGKPVDMWAIGVLAFFLLSGSMPFETDDNNSITEMTNTMNGTYDFGDEEWQYVSDAGDFGIV
jgi:calcium/calmodulin-dependent protein kinase I